MKLSMFSIFFILVFALVSCGGDDNSEDEGYSWTCEDSTDGWEKCSDNKIQYCHIVEGMDPHFHWSDDCDSKGYKCVEVAEGDAICVDESAACSAGEFSCDSDTNTAYNCVDGHKSVESCGSSKHCHEEDGAAICEETEEGECGGHGHLHDGECHCDEGYEIDPDNSENCIESVSFPELACNQFQNGEEEDVVAVQSFDEMSEAHADLDVPVHVTLVAGSENYIHFPVEKKGIYVMFLDKADIFDSAYDKSQNELLVSGGTANGMCSDVLADHWHITADYDDIPEDGKLPAVVKFKAVEDTYVHVIIKYKGEEE